jgi:hypothetical protein
MSLWHTTNDENQESKMHFGLLTQRCYETCILSARGYIVATHIEGCGRLRRCRFIGAYGYL